MSNIALIILAAGLGKRMKSDLPKVLAQTRDKTLLEHVIENTMPLNPSKRVTVVGHKRELVESLILGKFAALAISCAHQVEQKGTAHAVKCALPALENFVGTVLVLVGDAPLLRPETLRKLLEVHDSEKATVTALSFIETRPNAYGRLVRNPKTNLVEKIVEAKDATPQELAIAECNASIYAVDSAFLKPAVEKIKNENKQGEYYFTDIIELANKEGQRVAAYIVPDASETFGVNTPADLALINQALNQRAVEALLLSGVSIKDSASLYVEKTVQVSPGCVIGPQVQLLGNTSIAEGVEIEGCSYIKNTQIARGAKIKFGVRAEGAIIGAEASVGPFAHLREETHIGSHARVGNFVETKKATLGDHAKASHLSYLGDCEIGADSNIGAGTITCNYDGFNKFKTKIGKGVFIGSNSALVAPVTIEDGASVGAGSVIAKTTVEKDALALTRPPLKTVSGWAKNFRDKQKKR